MTIFRSSTMRRSLALIGAATVAFAATAPAAPQATPAPTGTATPSTVPVAAGPPVIRMMSGLGPTVLAVANADPPSPCPALPATSFLPPNAHSVPSSAPLNQVCAGVAPQGVMVAIDKSLVGTLAEVADQLDCIPPRPVNNAAGGVDNAPLFRIAVTLDVIPPIPSVAGALPTPSAASLVKDAQVTCDVTKSAVHAQYIERQTGSATVSSPALTVSIPWSRFPLRPGDWHLWICVTKSDGSPAFAMYESLLAVSRQVFAGSAFYAPYARLVTPAPSPKAVPSPLRLREIGADVAYLPDPYDMLTGVAAQNDANVSTQKAIAQVLKFAPISIPSPTIAPVVPQTLQTREQSAFNYQASSTALVDPALKPLFDTSPFSMQKVTTLDSGGSYSHGTSTFNATAFYGLEENLGYVKAYSATISFPPPSQPCSCPTPTPSPVPSPLPTVKAQIVSPASYSTVDDPAYQPSTVTLQYSDVLSKGALDRVGALAFNENIYTGLHETADSYESTTLHVLGSTVQDEDAASGPKTFGTAHNDLVGVSAAQTVDFERTSDQTFLSFLQWRESAGWQSDSPLFGPASGATTFVTPLSGPFAHFGVTTALTSVKKKQGKKQNGQDEEQTGPAKTQTAPATTQPEQDEKQLIATFDAFGYWVSNGYGDVSSATSMQAVLPVFRTSFLALFGRETGRMSDRIGVLQEGLVTSYAAEMFPSPAPGMPVVPGAPGTVRPQTANTVEIATSRDLGNKWTGQFSAGYVNGLSTVCQAVKGPPQTFSCSAPWAQNMVWSAILKWTGLQGGFMSAPITPTSGIASGSATRYFGPLSSSPGSITTFVSYSHCFVLSAAYTNAAYSQTATIPQKGVTTGAQIDMPLQGVVGATFGYSNVRGGGANGLPSLDQSAVYVQLHLWGQTNGKFSWWNPSTCATPSVLMPSPKGS
jgi:hypothetical protein